jgi:hypothetical protein
MEVDFIESANVFDVKATKEIFNQLKKINDSLPGAHRSLLSIVENTGTNSPRPRSYSTYIEIMKLVKSGVTVYTASKRLKIPYSTCHAYTKMTPDQVSKLKATELSAVSAKPMEVESQLLRLEVNDQKSAAGHPIVAESKAAHLKRTGQKTNVRLVVPESKTIELKGSGKKAVVKSVETESKVTKLKPKSKKD